MSMMHDTREESTLRFANKLRIEIRANIRLGVLLAEQVLDGDHIRLGIVRKAVFGGLVGAAAERETRNGSKHKV
jgi:hypothetical protein